MRGPGTGPSVATRTAGPVRLISSAIPSPPRKKQTSTKKPEPEQDVPVSFDGPESISIAHCKDVEGEWDAIYNNFGLGNKQLT